MKPEIIIDLSGAMDILSQKLAELTGGGWVEGPVREFHKQFLQTTDKHFEALKRAGINRGEEWVDYSPNTIGKYPPGNKRRPGYGGRPHKHGERYSPDSPLLQDTDLLKESAGRTFTQISPLEAEFSTEGVPYAAAHNDGGRKGKWILPKRAFQFFTGDDEETLAELTQQWLDT